MAVLGLRDAGPQVVHAHPHPDAAADVRQPHGARVKRQEKGDLKNERSLCYERSNERIYLRQLKYTQDEIIEPHLKTNGGKEKREEKGNTQDVILIPPKVFASSRKAVVCLGNSG